MTNEYTTPGAFLALWNDVDETRVDEYERWHTLEHVPERVWVPGFHCGTRYAALTGGFSRYLTLYEMDSLECLATPFYQELVEQPTPWSASMRPSFRNFLRKTCVMQVDAGHGRGAGVLAVRAVWPGDAQRGVPALRQFAARLLADGAPCCAMRVQVGLVRHTGPQAMANVDSAPQGHELVVIIHTSRPEELERLCAIMTRTVAATLGAPAWKHRSYYQVSSSVLHGEVQAASRPAPRLDLMPATAPRS